MAITVEKLDASIDEARKFIERAYMLKQKMESLHPDSTPYWYSGPPKESGAVRRQSMELTRSLADLRRS